MGIAFPVNTITAAGTNNVNVPGSYIQMVDNQATISTTCDTTAWVTVFSTTIVVASATNKVLVEYFMNDRSDQGTATWDLVYHRVLRDGTQIMYSGYNGAQVNYIGFYGRSFLDTPGAGSHTYVASVLSFGGTAWIGSYNSGSTAHYLRLYEIGT